MTCIDLRGNGRRVFCHGASDTTLDRRHRIVAEALAALNRHFTFDAGLRELTVRSMLRRHTEPGVARNCVPSASFGGDTTALRRRRPQACKSHGETKRPARSTGSSRFRTQDAPDGRGDGILPRWNAPAAQGRQAGDVLELSLATESGAAGIRNRYAACRQISAPGKSFSDDAQKCEGGHE